jgi:two-component system, NtrC family, sensor histidine kinase HydH
VSVSAERQSKIDWMDVLWLLFLLGLALLPPVGEIHKQLILLAFGVLQIFEGRLVNRVPRGRYYAVLLKILLAMLLISHTGGVGINSSYYPIFYVPVITAAVYFGASGTILWTLIASGAYLSYLYPALQEYELAPDAITELMLRILFFFLAAMVVNRFATENKRQTRRYREVAEQLAKTNRELEQVQAEARRSERLAALGQLSAGLAHEIRNPLGIIKGSAEMLIQRVASAEPLAAELAGYISSEVNRLSALVSRFLDFARPLRLETQPCSVPEVVDRALRAVAANWSGAAIQVECRYENDLPPAELDENLGEQVFVNLIQNAYDAMSETGGRLSISIGEGKRGERRGIEVQVADSGPGIAAELREQIFNPFFTTKKTGVGLGLSIVSKIVDEHHGSIEIFSGDRGESDSELRVEVRGAEGGSASVLPGKTLAEKERHDAKFGAKSGACFVIFLPLAEQAVAPAPQTASRA